MNYNHPYTFLAQKAVISIPITPQVTGVVNSVTDKANQRVKKGEVLFTIDPARYQARVDRLQADLVTRCTVLTPSKRSSLKPRPTPPACRRNAIAYTRTISAT